MTGSQPIEETMKDETTSEMMTLSRAKEVLKAAYRAGLVARSALGLATERRCEDCKFWSIFDDGDDVGGYRRGACKRYPPVIDPLAASKEVARLKEHGEDDPDENCKKSPDYWTWPCTHRDDCCGEFKLPY